MYQNQKENTMLVKIERYNINEDDIPTAHVCTDPDVTRLEKRLEEALSVIAEARKFMNRLPSDWFSEIIAIKLDNQLK